MNYKSVRLLAEAIHKEMEVVRRILMASSAEPSVSALETLNGVRELVDQLAAKADRPSLEDVPGMAPADYVAAMKPLVAGYHRQLMSVDLLTPCLCEDLRATAAVLILVGDGRTVVRGAHHPDHPEAALAVEAVIESIDAGTRRVVEGALAAAPVSGASFPDAPGVDGDDDDEDGEREGPP
jgi:hypothetical protein